MPYCVGRLEAPLGYNTNARATLLHKLAWSTGPFCGLLAPYRREISENFSAQIAVILMSPPALLVRQSIDRG